MDVSVNPDVVEFYKNCLVGNDVSDPVATLIYGSFSDEIMNNYRIAVSERMELQAAPSQVGQIYRVPGLSELYVPGSLLAAIEGKEMRMSGDVVVFSGRA